MQKKRATVLQMEWGNKPCEHVSLAKEYDLGKRTGNYVCTQCGAMLTFREKAERAAERTPKSDSSHTGASMKKSSRQIPDFSRKSSKPKPAGALNTAPASKAKAVASAPPRPKPQSTSGKSGQRGK
jgi:predicted adenine nucleotide alpha hydrolase (AANH) superfamily ATPase